MAQSKRTNTEILTLTIETASKDGFDMLFNDICGFALQKRMNPPKKGEFMSKVISAGVNAMREKTSEQILNIEANNGEVSA